MKFSSKMADNIETGADENIKNSENKCRENQKYPIVVTVFYKVVRDDINFIDAVCNLCKLFKKFIRGQFKAPSNFTKHIKVCEKLSQGKHMKRNVILTIKLYLKT